MDLEKPADNFLRPRPGSPFQKGDDPRRVIPRGPRSHTLAQQAIARKLLADSVYQKVQELLELSEAVAKDAPPCALCQRGMPRDDDFRLRAIVAILDRAGLGPTAKLEVSQAPNDGWVNHLTLEEAEIVHRIREAARQRAAAIDVEATG